MLRLPKPTVEQWREIVGRQAECVLEIGCHDGSDTVLLLDAFPEASFHCWEPDARPRRRFVERLGRNPRVTLRSEAVIAWDGRAPWYASHGKMSDDPDPEAFPAAMREDWDASGSTMLPTGHVGFPSWLTFAEEGTVPAIRLDTWLNGHPEIAMIDLIWADIQAAELRMIVGGQRTLARTRYLYLEVFDPQLTPDYSGPDQLYQNQPPFADLLKALPGWALMGFYEDDCLLFRNSNVRATP